VVSPLGSVSVVVVSNPPAPVVSCIVVVSCSTIVVSVSPGRWPMVLSVGTPVVSVAVTAVVSP
jgi:hypothetical protein